MRFAFLPIVITLGLWSASGQCQAATLPPLHTAYDATATIDFGSTHIDSTVNADGAKERRTFDSKMGEQTVILRHDQGKVYLLIAALNAAISMDNGQIPGGYNLNMLQTIPVTLDGTDTVAGMNANRYIVNGQSDQGSFAGKVWCTSTGIILKVDGIVTQDGKTTPVKIAVTDIHVRAQDPALFDIPGTMKVVPYAMAQMLMKGAKGMALPAQ